MTQIIENRSDIDGIVEGVSADDPDGLTLFVRVNAARPVAGLANLLADDVGEVIAVRVRGDVAAPDAGAGVSLRVRKTGVDRFFADEESLQIT